MVKSQVLWSDSYGSRPLQTYTTPYSVTNYTSVPPSYLTINDGHNNNTGNLNAPNKPFHVASLKTTGWAVVYNPVENDTFLVSTSWLDSNLTADRFVVTPSVNISNGTVLSWYAMAPDASYPDGYEVYVTNQTTVALNASSFLPNDRVFSVADGNTTGGGEKNTWIRRGVSLAAYSGQNLKVAFRNNSKNMYQLWIDDVIIENLANSRDAELSPGLIYKYNTPSTNGNIQCRLTNRGYSNINDITLNYSINGAGTQTETFTLSPSLPVYGYTDITFTTPYSIPTPGRYKVKIWVGLVNGNPDQFHNNDTLNSFITIVTSAPAKKVLVEQFLNADDGYTPDAQDKLQALTTASVIPVNFHDTDSLKNAQGANLILSYRKKNSTALIDRNYFSDINSVPVERFVYGTRIIQRESAIVPAGVNIIGKTYISSTRQLTFAVQANFTGEVVGDYRINAYLTENNVYGPYFDTTNNGWNQLNYMYNIPWSNYYQKGYFDTGANGYVMTWKNYMHQHVLTAAPDGPWGVAAVVSQTGGTQGASYTRTFSITLPTATNGQFRYNPDNIYIVGFVAEYSLNKNYRTVLNATQDKLNSNPEVYVGIKDIQNFHSTFSVFPNPTSGNLNIIIPENSFMKKPMIRICDITGREVYRENSGLLYGWLQLDLQHIVSGTYYISLEDGNTKSVKKLILTR